MLLTLVLLPVLAGIAVWIAGDDRRGLRAWLTLGALGVTGVVATVSAAVQPRASLRWGAGLVLSFEVDDIARAPVVLVAVVGAAVATYALGYGEERGRGRLVGLLVLFVGTMELLLLAGDLLTLLVAWELVGLVSWGLIAHHWSEDAPARANEAFIATRAGDLGLFVAAGAAYAATGTFDFSALPAASGALAAAVAGGVLLAAVAKSAQIPFSPWLFSAMAGPTPASALLHSATMVAAGAYLLARLQPFLDTVAWFGPTTIVIGLATALAGGVVAAVQPEAKKLLAASTSAQYGLMFVAVGAGYPTVAVAHLVAHGLFKALLFVSAGVAIDASGTQALAGMRLGRALPVVAGFTAVGTLALAGLPPLGAAWSKEEVVSAGVHTAPWVGVAVVVAGGLSAFYAARFQLVAFGRRDGDDDTSPKDLVEGLDLARVALAGLAVLTVATAVVWTSTGTEWLQSIVGASLPPGETWEVAAALTAVGVAIYGAVVLDRRGRLVAPFSAPAWRRVAAWMGIPALTRVMVVDPVLAAARGAAAFDDRVVDAGVRLVGSAASSSSVALARFDDRVVDAGVRGISRLAAWTSRVADRVGEVGIDAAIRGLAGLVASAGRDGRRLQSGQAHQYYAGIAVVVLLLIAVTATWS